MAFLDFGMTKHLDRDQIELEIAALEAIFDDDPERLRVALHDLGFLNDPRKVDAELLMEHVRAVGGWYMEDREVTIDSARVMEAIAAVSDPRSSFYRVMRRENLPANELMGRRMESGVLAVLGQLEATRNWYRIGREWWFGEPPSTELGELERAWAEGTARRLEELVLAGEDLGDRVVDEDPADRVLEDVGAGELGDQLGSAVASGTVSVTTMPASGDAAASRTRCRRRGRAWRRRTPSRRPRRAPSGRRPRACRRCR